MVEALSQMIGRSSDGLDISTAERKEVINQLMGALESESGAGLDVPAGESGYVERLRERGSEKPAVAGVKSLTGKEVGVSQDGTLSVGERTPVMDLASPGDTLLSGLWALSRPDGLKIQNEDEAAAAQAKLADNLLTQLEHALAVSDDQPGKFRRHQAMGAAVAALAANREILSAEQSEKLFALLPKLSTPLQKMMVQRAG